MVRRSGFKILCLQNIEPPSTKHFKGGDSEYGCINLCWFPCLGGEGSKYYGCEILNLPPPLNILRVEIQNMVGRH
jgi:hypothetical protein